MLKREISALCAGNDPLDYTDPLGLFGFMDISDFAANVVDGALAGIPSRIMGIPQSCWDSTGSAWVRPFASAVGGFTVSGIGNRLAVRAVGTGLFAPAISGAIGGAAGGGWSAAGTNVNTGAGGIGLGAGAGLAGGAAGGALTGQFGRGGAAAAGSTAASEVTGYSVGHGTGQGGGGAAGSSAGSKDSC